jgi:hypothetical protein
LVEWRYLQRKLEGKQKTQHKPRGKLNDKRLS